MTSRQKEISLNVVIARVVIYGEPPTKGTSGRDFLWRLHCQPYGYQAQVSESKDSCMYQTSGLLLNLTWPMGLLSDT